MKGLDIRKSQITLLGKSHTSNLSSVRSDSKDLASEFQSTSPWSLLPSSVY